MAGAASDARRQAISHALAEGRCAVCGAELASHKRCADCGVLIGRGHEHTRLIGGLCRPCHDWPRRPRGG